MFFHQKAHEADEESSEMIFGNRSVSIQMRCIMYAISPLPTSLSLGYLWVDVLRFALFSVFYSLGRDVVEAQDDMLLDLHDHGAKVAIQLLKCRLSSLSGIPCVSLDFCFYIFWFVLCELQLYM